VLLSREVDGDGQLAALGVTGTLAVVRPGRSLVSACGLGDRPVQGYLGPCPARRLPGDHVAERRREPLAEFGELPVLAMSITASAAPRVSAHRWWPAFMVRSICSQ
jgi:hypothetical protein